MKLVSKFVRQNAWKYHHGEICMGMIEDQCSVTAKYDHHSKISTPALFYSHITSVYVLYGRPFQQHKFRLGDSAVPKHKRGLHSEVLAFRNRMFAHIEMGSDAIKDEKGEALANMIVNNTGTRLTCTSSSLIPTHHGLFEINELATDIRKYCQSNLSKIMSEAIGDYNKLPLGKFKINLSDTELAPLLVKLNE